MKKLLFNLIILISCFMLLPNIVVEAASSNTIAGLRKDLSALKQKQQENLNKKALTKSEIKSIENSILNSRIEIDENRDAIEQAKIDIENLNIEIAKTEEEIKSLMNNYQIASGENIYLDYIFNSSSYADMVYRYTLTKQIAEYNNQQIDDHNEKIAYNEQLKINLAAREVELENLIARSQADRVKLDGQLAKIDEASLDISSEITALDTQIETLVELGCGEDEDIDACMVVKGALYFLRPLTKGIITSPFGYRTNPITGKKNSFHSGVDIGGVPEGTSIYSTANGTVGAVINATASNPRCGGRAVYIYHIVGGKKYTSAYLHLLSINVKVGQAVTSNTIIGTVGGGAKTKAWETCSTGTHLHFGLATGYYLRDHSSFSSYAINPKDPLKLPNKGGSFSGR